MLNLDEEMKKLKNRGSENPLPMNKMVKIVAASFDRAATQAAHKIYWDKQFYKQAKLKKLNKVEQDRIFNELIVAGIVLVMLTLESPDLRIPDEMKDYFRLVSAEMNRAHIDQLIELGIEKKYRKMWKKLINKRYDEYSKDKNKARQAAMQVETKHLGRDLEINDLKNISLLIPVQTTAINAHHHICRGKTKGRDEQFKRLLKLLGRFYIEIRIPVEGGKITKLKKVYVKAKSLFDKLNI